MLSLTYCSYSLPISRICYLFFFLYVTSSFKLVMNQSVSKVFKWFVLDDSVAINNSEKDDSWGFKHFDLLRGFQHFVTFGTTGNIIILKESHDKNNTLLIITTQPLYLQYPTRLPLNPPSSLSLLVWQISNVWNSRLCWFCPFYKI